LADSELMDNRINVLYHNIDEQFRLRGGPTAERVNKFIEVGTIKGLDFQDTLHPIRGPYADLDRQVFVLQAGFLSYLWTVCYFIVGVIEIYNDMALNGTPVVRLSDSDKFPLLNHTFAWGRSLKQKDPVYITPWPDDIANPELEGIRTRQANHLLVLAVTYLLYHELGHLVLHRESKELARAVQSPFYEPNAFDARRLRMMEIQADEYALDCLFPPELETYDHYLNSLAALAAHFGEFFVRDFPDTRSKNYPDIDERLKRVIRRIQVTDPGHKMNVELTCAIGLQVFLTLTFADYIPETGLDFSFENFDDLQAYLFDIIDDWKIRYNTYSA